MWGWIEYFMILRRLAAVEQGLDNVKEKQRVTQQDIDQLTSELSTTKATVDNIAIQVPIIKSGILSIEQKEADLQAQIDALTKQNPTLDLTGLQSAADALAADVTSANAAVQDLETTLPPPPTQPAPPAGT